MNIYSRLQAICLLLLTLALGSCATTIQPIGEWRDSAFDRKLDNILIVAAFERSTQRRVFEDIFIESLALRQVSAEPSYRLMTTATTISRQDIESAIKGQKIDAVLVTRLLGIREVEVYNPPDISGHHQHFYRYYRHALEQSTPGYYRKYRLYSLETTVYDALTGNPVWSMQSDAIEPTLLREEIEAQVDLTVNRLTSAGLLPPNS